MTRTAAERLPNEYDLAIVGAGIVGAALALQLAPMLAERGLRLALIEAGPAPEHYQGERFDPRVVALTPASQALFERLGLWHRVRGERACPYRDMQVWDGEASGNIGFSADELGRDQLGHIVENSLLVRHLRQALSYQQAVAFYQPRAVTRLEPAHEGEPVRLTLDDGSVLRAGLVVAADGAHSGVRERAGFEVREWAYRQKAIVTTVRTELPHQYCARQRFMATGPLAFLPLHRSLEPEGSAWDSHYSSIVWSADLDLADELMALDDANFRDRLGRDFERTLGAVTEVDKRHAIPLHQRHARDYIRPGIALVGDAAHSIHPLAGQGVNLGLKDVMALAEELKRGLHRGLPLGDYSALRRYQRRRMGDNLSMMALMESFKRLFGSRRAELIWLRSAGMSRVGELPWVKNTLARKATGV